VLAKTDNDLCKIARARVARIPGDSICSRFRREQRDACQQHSRSPHGTHLDVAICWRVDSGRRALDAAATGDEI
jgi:hypothetical protein